MFKKKEKLGDRKIKSKAFEKAIDVGNYTPERYLFTKSWADYLTGANKRFCGIIKRAKPDDLNDSMMDSEIDSHVAELKAYIQTQKLIHLRVIRHHRSILNGEMTKARMHLENLRADLAEIENELSAIKAMNGGN